MVDGTNEKHEADLIHWGERYLQLGFSLNLQWPAVDGRCGCPERDCDARPGKHSHGPVRARIRTAGELRRQVARHPESNLAIITGQAFAVLDVDVGSPSHPSAKGDVIRNGEGWDILDNGQLILTLPVDTLRARTGSGGFHFVFHHIDGLPAGRISPSIELKAFRNQTVTVAPSRHVTGEAYSWDNWGCPVASWPIPLPERKAAPERQVAREYTTADGGWLDELESAVLARKGKRWRGKNGPEIRFQCPSGLHEDKSPSASWNRGLGAWNCLSCGSRGNSRNLAWLLEIQLPPGPKSGKSTTDNRRRAEQCREWINNQAWKGGKGPQALAVATWIVDHILRADGQVVKLSERYVADNSGILQRTARKALAELRKLGMLKRVQPAKGNQPALYSLSSNLDKMTPKRITKGEGGASLLVISFGAILSKIEGLDLFRNRTGLGKGCEALWRAILARPHGLSWPELMELHPTPKTTERRLDRLMQYGLVDLTEAPGEDVGDCRNLRDAYRRSMFKAVVPANLPELIATMKSNGATARQVERHQQERVVFNGRMTMDRLSDGTWCDRDTGEALSNEQALARLHGRPEITVIEDIPLSAAAKLVKPTKTKKRLARLPQVRRMVSGVYDPSTEKGAFFDQYGYWPGPSETSWHGIDTTVPDTA